VTSGKRSWNASTLLSRSEALRTRVTSLLIALPISAPFFTEFEGHILRNFRKYAQRNTVPIDSVWNWLAVVHHYGLPTRLLDWTYSPYVALHFATECLDTFTDDAIG
jgi:FRG domain-containing protein